MTRHVKNKTGWAERSNNKIAGKTGLPRIMDNILGINHRLNRSASSMQYRLIEGFKARAGLASVKESEALLRRARMLQ